MSMQQLAFFVDVTKSSGRVTHATFSHDGLCPEVARKSLEDRYAPLFEETERFSRKLVSFQANKTETLHSWMKYREGFSADLIELLMNELSLGQGKRVLDPFAGSCTTLLVAKMLGVDATGIEILPHCHLAWEAKSRAFAYNLDELKHLRHLIATVTPPATEYTFPTPKHHRKRRFPIKLNAI